MTDRTKLSEALDNRQWDYEKNDDGQYVWGVDEGDEAIYLAARRFLALMPDEDGNGGHPVIESDGFVYEVGWCAKHDDVAKRYEGDAPDFSCWWECVVETSARHHPADFVPLLGRTITGNTE